MLQSTETNADKPSQAYEEQQHVPEASEHWLISCYVHPLWHSVKHVTSTTHLLNSHFQHNPGRLAPECLITLVGLAGTRMSHSILEFHGARTTEAMMTTGDMQSSQIITTNTPTPVNNYNIVTDETRRFTHILSLRFNGLFPGKPGLAGVYWSKGWWRWWWQLEL